jgi:hypothetical protein
MNPIQKQMGVHKNPIQNKWEYTRTPYKINGSTQEPHTK